jgi:hypothetical protein
MAFHCAAVMVERSRFCAWRHPGLALASNFAPSAVSRTPRSRRSSAVALSIHPFLFSTAKFRESVVLSKASVLASMD